MAAVKNPAQPDDASLFQNGPFVRYMSGEAISMTGTWMQVMAQVWVMTSLTTSAVMMGLVNFAASLPMIVLALPAGVLADRHDKRKILLATQGVQIALALFLGHLVATGEVKIWHIIAVALVLGVSNSFEMPAATALVPELVRHNQIAKAIAVDRSVFHGTRLVGPAVAGYAIGFWGAASAFYINALSYVALIAALLTIRPRPAPPHHAEAGTGGIREALDYVRSDSPTLAMLALMASCTLFVFPVMIVMLPLYARQVLDLGSSRLGLLMAISSVGSLTGSIGLVAAPSHKRRILLITAAAGVGAALAGLSQARAFPLAAVCMVGVSLGVSTLIGLANTIVQERAPSALRGRVSAIAGFSFFGLMPLASLGITSVADMVGLRRAILLGAFLFMIAAVFVLVLKAGRFNPAPAPPPEGETSSPKI